MSAPPNPSILRALPEAAIAVPSFLDGADSLSKLARNYLDALLHAERQEANRLVLDAVRAGVKVVDIYLRVFQRCQREQLRGPSLDEVFLLCSYLDRWMRRSVIRRSCKPRKIVRLV